MRDDARDDVGPAQEQDSSAEVRDDTAGQRDQAGQRRDETADRRDHTADQRDSAAGHRDSAAGRRDSSADLRDETADRRDQDADRRETSGRAATAPGGRSPSARVRRDAASDRRHASRDRRAGASERVHAGLDRSTALADRDAGAGERSSAELDRATALADRGAAASERAEQVRSAAISRGKSEFLSRMSHELRTPLNAILGFGQLLELDTLSAEQRDSVEHITAAGRHLLRLIDEVLDISQVERGELRLVLQPVSLARVVGESLGMLRPLAAARGVRLEAAPASAAAHVRADPGRLQQVVVNLLSNAVKYNRAGGEVQVTWGPASGARARLVVADTGVGIHERDLARLFVPFDRLGAEQTDVQGTGLGLSLTRQLVEAMGGEIGATSRLGVGSSFWVELPLADAPREQPADTGAARAPARAVPVAAGPRTVLYVEDNLSNVALVERIVSRRPEVTLSVALRGRQGLDLAWRHRPDLVLLDLHLPDMPGDEVLRQLRADPRTAATPVVVLSADATSGQAERLRADGATAYLTKPFDLPRLLAVLDGTALTEPPPGPPAAPPAAISGPLDPAVIASLHDLGRESAAGADGIRSLVTTYLDDSEERFDDLRVAVGHGDAADMERAAHSLAGSSANLGARVLAAGCHDLEARARAGAVDDAVRLWPGLDEVFSDARAALVAEFLRSGEPRQ